MRSRSLLFIHVYPQRWAPLCTDWQLTNGTCWLVALWYAALHSYCPPSYNCTNGSKIGAAGTSSTLCRVFVASSVSSDKTTEYTGMLTAATSAGFILGRSRDEYGTVCLFTYILFVIVRAFISFFLSQVPP
jgi:hypothetical protein